MACLSSRAFLSVKRVMKAR